MPYSPDNQLSRQKHLSEWQHTHDFVADASGNERRTFYVLILTAVTMIVEIVAGTIYGSMALLADGWHMGTHVAAFMITLFAYRYARKNKDNPEFAFGTGKVNVLGGFASAVALAVVALMMLVESIERLSGPIDIRFNEAITVAVIGLIVNLVSALLLKDHHGHGHEHGHAHEHVHGHKQDHKQNHDHNLSAAYMHVLADALTSLLAIAALLVGKYWGLSWLDPVMGIVGGIIIARWAYGLIKDTSPILLDGSINEVYQTEVLKKLEEDGDTQVVDIHIWRISANHFAGIISLVTHQNRQADYYRKLLANFDKIDHLSIEVNICQFDECFDIANNKV